MKTLTVKDIRKILEETLSKFYDFVDYGINPTKVMDDIHEFRIEFRIYDADFWMDISTAIDHVYIASQSFGEAGHIGTIMIWLQPDQYNKKNFKFGWRTDLEKCFDGFRATLFEKFKNTPEPNIKIGPLKEDQLMKNIEAEEAASYEEYAENPPKKSVLSQILDKLYEEDPQILDKLYEETPVAKVDEAKVGECKIGGTSIFNGLKEEDEDEAVEW